MSDLITADDVKAIKETRTVVFSWKKETNETTVRLAREIRLDSDTAERDAARIAKTGRWHRSYISEYQIDYEHTLPVALPTRVTQYEGTADHACSVHLFASSADDAAGSVLRLLRSGDAIGLRFVGSNNSDNTRSVGWVRDETYLRIMRGDKLVGEFLVDVYVGPDNTARIVRNY